MKLHFHGITADGAYRRVTIHRAPQYGPACTRRNSAIVPRLDHHIGGLDLAVRLGASTRNARVLLMSRYTERINGIEDAKLPLIRNPFSPDKLVERIQEMIVSAKDQELVPA